MPDIYYTFVTMSATFEDNVFILKEVLEEQLNIAFSYHRTDRCTYLVHPQLSILLYPDKTVKRESVPFRAVHIDEDLLRVKFEIILARITSLLNASKRIYARKTIVARIDKKNSISFLEDNHLQSAIAGKYRYGLYDKGELVAIAIFSGGRSMNDRPEGYRSFELLRFCSKTGFNVIGGLSKLIKAFRKDFDPGDIMTYTDRDWNLQSSLHRIGFQETSVTPPIRFWVTTNQRFHLQDEKVFQKISEQYRDGFLKENSGSSKMILFIK